MALTPNEIAGLLAKQRVPAHEAANRVYTVLEEHPGGLDMKMILHLAGLEPGQYRGGYNWMLDNFEEPLWVKNYVDRQWVYFTADNNLRACDEDWARTIKTQVTRATREFNKAHMIALHHPSIEHRLAEEMARTRLEQLKIEKDRLDQ